MSYIAVYLDAQLKQFNGLRHHAIIINVTCFAHFVYRQTLAPATITSVLCCNEGIVFVVPDTTDSRVSILHIASGILDVRRSPT